MRKTLDLEKVIDSDDLAIKITEQYDQWNRLRVNWLDEKTELRNYLYATSTRYTSNNKNPWVNSTTTPKLTQIYDNLKANYSAALFPNSNWMKWTGVNPASQQKAKAVQGYLKNKLVQSKFDTVSDKIIDDFILYGNCFGTVEWVEEYAEVDGDTVPVYVGPRIVRVSPLDIVFDPTAADFKQTPKVIRSVLTLGELAQNPEMSEILGKMLDARRRVADTSYHAKAKAFIADGFSSISDYYKSDFVEVLTFYGDIFDKGTGELRERRKITIVDRAYVLSDEPQASWLGEDPVYHAGWRTRPDNLWAMGPLDNLVGLQYRIDHLENLKADVFDQIALPTVVVTGDVEDFNLAPGERIYAGEEGRVDFLRPDATALNADLQISVIEQKMEELAGAPRQAMGIRTPGEKTAFEVNSLMQSASRIFQHKAAKLEREFFEPVLNCMLESSRRNMMLNEVVRVFDDDIGAQTFLTITKEDITARGNLVPIGARHFAERAQRVQELSNLMTLKAQDPSIGVHISGKEAARIFTDILDEPTLFGEYIGLEEQGEAQTKQSDVEADVMEKQQVSVEHGL